MSGETYKDVLIHFLNKNISENTHESQGHVCDHFNSRPEFNARIMNTPSGYMFRINIRTHGTSRLPRNALIHCGLCEYKSDFRPNLVRHIETQHKLGFYCVDPKIKKNNLKKILYVLEKYNLIRIDRRNNSHEGSRSSSPSSPSSPSSSSSPPPPPAPSSSSSSSSSSSIYTSSSLSFSLPGSNSNGDDLSNALEITDSLNDSQIAAAAEIVQQTSDFFQQTSDPFQQMGPYQEQETFDYSFIDQGYTICFTLNIPDDQLFK